MTKYIQLQNNSLLNDKELIEKYNNETNEKELTQGILFLLKEYYVGKFEVNEKKILITFNNNQKFCIYINQLI